MSSGICDIVEDTLCDTQRARHVPLHQDTKRTLIARRNPRLQRISSGSVSAMTLLYIGLSASADNSHTVMHRLMWRSTNPPSGH